MGVAGGWGWADCATCSRICRSAVTTVHAHPVQTVGGSWACSGKRHPGGNARVDGLREDEMLWQPAAARSARSAAVATAAGRRRSMAHCACSNCYGVSGAAATAGASGECRNRTLGSGGQQRSGGTGAGWQPNNLIMHAGALAQSAAQTSLPAATHAPHRTMRSVARPADCSFRCALIWKWTTCSEAPNRAGTAPTKLRRASPASLTLSRLQQVNGDHAADQIH